MRPSRPVLAVLGLLLGVVGAVLLAIAITLPRPHVRAVRTSATAQTALTRGHCESGQSLQVSFAWAGQNRVEVLDAPTCQSEYRTGQTVAIFVASNDPSNVGPTSNWILSPDEHDPFDFIGPNGLPTFIGLVGGGTLIGAGILCLYGWRSKPQSLLSV